MKTEVKAVIASVVVIVLCLTAVGGITYSWFSDSEQADIDITTGQIDLNVNVSDVKIQSFGFDSIDVTTENTPVITSLGGSVKYSESSTDSQTAITITFSNAAPGDTLSFSCSGTLNNTINVIYQETATITSEGSVSENNPFIITGLSDTSVMYPANTSSNDVNLSTKTVTIKMDENAGNEYQNMKYRIQIVFEAVQANAPVSDTTSVSVIEGQNSVTVSPSSDSGSAVNVSSSISFVSNGTGPTLTVSALDSANTSYTVANGAILAGIDVTSSEGGSALNGTDVTVTFVLDGNLSAIGLTVYHNGTEFTPKETPVKTYDSMSDTTTFSFVTDSGFSTYFVSANVDAKIGSKYYTALYTALTEVKDGDVVDVLSDCATNSITTIVDYTLNMNGHTISSSGNYDSLLSIRASDVIINGGKFSTAYSPLEILNGANVTVNNSIFESKGDVTVGRDFEYWGIYNLNDTLVLNDVVFNASGSNCVTGYQNATIEVNGGTFTSTEGAAFCTNGSNGNGINSWTVDGATFNVSVGDNRGNDTNVIGVGIQCHNEGTWTISNCTFNMDNGVAISTRGGDVTISNCVYNYTNEFDNKTTGLMQYTSSVIYITTPHAVATSYVEGSYGYDGSNAYLTIDGERITLIENKVEYYDFGTPTA